MKLKKLTTILTMGIIMFSSLTLNASAAGNKTYTEYFQRGAVISWVKNSVKWSTKNYSKITSCDYWQSHGGICVEEGGIKKLSKSNSSMYYLNYKTKFKAGAQIYGMTLGYSRTYTDQLRVDCAGNIWLTTDV